MSATRKRRGLRDLELGTLFAALALLLAPALPAQQTGAPFVFPMKPGDVHVYSFIDDPDDIFQPGSRGTKVQRIFKATAWEGNTDNVDDTVRHCAFAYDDAFRGFSYGESYSLLINERNFVTRLNDDGSWWELFPLQPYDKATYLDLQKCFLRDGIPEVSSYSGHISAQFDTTIFGRRVRGYTLILQFLNTHTYLIADTFGVAALDVWYDFGHNRYTLNAASIDGVDFKRNFITKRFAPMCASNKYQYSRNLYPKLDSMYTVLGRDSSVTGIPYAFLSGFAAPQGWSQLYREEPWGLYSRIDGKDSLLLPYTLALGTQVGRGMVTAIGDTTINGSIRKRIAVRQLLDSVYDHLTWVEAIGMTTHSHGRLSGGWSYRDTLRAANICGAVFGTLGLDDPPAAAQSDFVLQQNYPNPFSSSTTISFHVAERAPVRVTVHDALGRHVATLADEVMDAGERQLRFDARAAQGGAALLPGVYTCRVGIGNAVYARSMIVVR
ncbi:MAG: T9SS type A sorting domain-containing protein [Ignavibacteria bacterium]|nr:T9SS type A sorting domain-containing protein [Ignavibacteria bacterium]